jgi:hypothetical protein
MSRPSVLTMIVLAGIVLLNLPQLGTAAVERHPPKAHRPGLLWKKFPLRQHTVKATTPQWKKPRIYPTTPGLAWNPWVPFGTILALTAAAGVIVILLSCFRFRQ